jgi:hypothetical protein
MLAHDEKHTHPPKHCLLATHAHGTCHTRVNTLKHVAQLLLYGVKQAIERLVCRELRLALANPQRRAASRRCQHAAGRLVREEVAHVLPGWAAVVVVRDTCECHVSFPGAGSCDRLCDRLVDHSSWHLHCRCRRILHKTVTIVSEPSMHLQLLMPACGQSMFYTPAHAAAGGRMIQDRSCGVMKC